MNGVAVPAVAVGRLMFLNEASFCQSRPRIFPPYLRAHRVPQADLARGPTHRHLPADEEWCIVDHRQIR